MENQEKFRKGSNKIKWSFAMVLFNVVLALAFIFVIYSVSDILNPDFTDILFIISGVLIVVCFPLLNGILYFVGICQCNKSLESECLINGEFGHARTNMSYALIFGIIGIFIPLFPLVSIINAFICMSRVKKLTWGEEETDEKEKDDEPKTKRHGSPDTDEDFIPLR